MADAKARIVLTLDDKATRALGANFNKLETQTTSFTKRAQTNFLQLASKIFVAQQAFFALSKGIQALVGPAIEFESAFTGVRKTVDATEEEFSQLREEILKLSTTIPVAAKDLAKIQEIAGQLGIRGVKNLTKFTEAIAKIAVTTNLTQEEAAIGFARIAAVVGEPITNIENMASSVVDLGNKFEVNEREILQMANRLSGAGKVAKLTTADIFGISTAMASVGVEAQAGGTAVQKILLSLQKQGKTGIGAFVEFVDDIRNAGDKAALLLDELGFKDVRLQRAFLTLAGAGDKLTDTIKVSNEAFAESIALQDEANKRFKTTESQLILLQNEFKKLSIDLGTLLLPAVNTVTSKFIDLLNVITDVAAFAGRLSVGGDANFGVGQNLFSDEDAERLRQLQREQGEAGSRGPGGAPEGFLGFDEGGKPMFEEVAQDIQKATQELNSFQTAFKKINDDLPTLAEQSAKLISGQVELFAKGFGDAFAQMIVRGENFAEAMEEVFQNMALTFISFIAEMTIKWLAFTALTAAFGVPGGGGFFGGFIPGLQRGGKIESPGNVIVGERGPELLSLPRGATVSPLEGGAVDSSTSININMENANFSSDSDVEDIFTELSELLQENRRSRI